MEIYRPPASENSGRRAASCAASCEASCAASRKTAFLFSLVSSSCFPLLCLVKFGGTPAQPRVPSVFRSEAALPSNSAPSSPLTWSAALSELCCCLNTPGIWCTCFLRLHSTRPPHPPPRLFVPSPQQHIARLKRTLFISDPEAENVQSAPIFPGADVKRFELVCAKQSNLYDLNSSGQRQYLKFLM